MEAERQRSTIRFRPTAPLENLRRRAVLYRILRSFFDARNFVETSTPTLSRDVVVDRFVEAIPVKLNKSWRECDDFSSARFSSPEVARREETTFYLQTSPEFAMKRLLAAGMDAIYQLAPAYRQGDRGKLHNVEFTMLEWYRKGDDYESGRALLSRLVAETSRRFYEETSIEPQRWTTQETKQIPFGRAFCDATQLDPHRSSIADLRAFADANNVSYPESYKDDAEKDDWIDLIFSEVVQPTLGFDFPVLLYDYPGTQSQLAQTGQAHGCEVARRFELFANGIELANGYDELLDASVLRARIDCVAGQRRRDGSAELPRESRLLAAMDAGLPPSSGCALGVDRYLCVLLGTRRVDDVLAFPTELA